MCSDGGEEITHVAVRVKPWFCGSREDLICGSLDGHYRSFSLASLASSNSSRSRNSSRKRLLNDSLQPFSHGRPGATWIGCAPLVGNQPQSASQMNSLPLSLRMLTGAPRLPIT